MRDGSAQWRVARRGLADATHSREPIHYRSARRHYVATDGKPPEEAFPRHGSSSGVTAMPKGSGPTVGIAVRVVLVFRSITTTKPGVVCVGAGRSGARGPDTWWRNTAYPIRSPVIAGDRRRADTTSVVRSNTDRRNYASSVVRRRALFQARGRARRRAVYDPEGSLWMSRSRSAGVMRRPLIAETVEKVYRAATGADSDDD